jgi:hypothetical protein
MQSTDLPDELKNGQKKFYRIYGVINFILPVFVEKENFYLILNKKEINFFGE